MDEIDLNVFVGASNGIYYATPSPAPGPDLTINLYDVDKANILFTKSSTTINGASLILVLADADPNLPIGDYPFEITSGGQIIRQGTAHVLAAPTGMEVPLG
jgi:hypothetical protein